MLQQYTFSEKKGIVFPINIDYSMYGCKQHVSRHIYVKAKPQYFTLLGIKMKMNEIDELSYLHGTLDIPCSSVNINQN